MANWRREYSDYQRSYTDDKFARRRPSYSPRRQVKMDYHDHPRNYGDCSYTQVVREGCPRTARPPASQFAPRSYTSAQRAHNHREPRLEDDHLYARRRRGSNYRRPGRQPAPSASRVRDQQWGRRGPARRVSPPNKPTVDEANFTLKTRAIFRLIKATHHLANVTADQPPASITKMMNHLATSIKPAAPTALTLSHIQGNAMNWSHTTLIILRDHYQEDIDNITQVLIQLEAWDWARNLDIASKWAKNQFGRRLRTTTLKQVRETLGQKAPKEQRTRRVSMATIPLQGPCVATGECTIQTSDDEEETRPVTLVPDTAPPSPQDLPQVEVHSHHPPILPTPPQTITAAQTRLSFSRPAMISTLVTRRPFRHLNTLNKMKDWRIHHKQKTIIMGDSNVYRIPPFTYQYIQIDSYPGATFRHAESILAKSQASPTVQKLILAFGINNKAQSPEKTSIRQLQGAIRMATRACPNAQHLLAIPKLPEELFNTEKDRVHWSQHTERRLLDHWVAYLNPNPNPSNETGDRYVFNLSKCFTPTGAQLSLLCRGLTFIPVVDGHSSLKTRSQIRHDIQQCHRRLRLAVYYRDQPDSTPPPFTHRSTWVPPRDAMPPSVLNLISSDLEYFHNEFRTSRLKPNLNPWELEAHKALVNNKDIIIKPADKGSAIVIMDREQYLWEGYRQLQDTTCYTKLPKPIYKDTIPMVDKILKSLFTKRFINHKQLLYLQGNSEPRARLFYMLPKIHKPRPSWNRAGEIPPGRPIVSDCDSETYYTAEYIDSFLNPLSVHHPSYVKDTYHFVQIVQNLVIPTDALLFTMDVDSLYTNIDIQEGIQSIRNIFHKYPDAKRPDKELLQLLEINLARNDFEFDNNYFLQIKGTAIGKKFAPAYANIFMAEWDTSALAACPKRPTQFYRYLDDIWGIWTHSKEEFTVFLSTLNSHNPSIKVKSTSSDTAVDFLDTTVYKGPKFNETGKLDIKVFFKETDTHALLYRSSFHPQHTYAGLLKSQLLRFHRICTRREDFELATQTLFSALINRGYTHTMFRKALKSYLDPKPQNLDTLLPVIATYSPHTVRLLRVLRNNFNRFYQESNLLPDHSLIAAYRRNKNLQDSLVRAKIRPLSAPKRTTGKDSFYKHKTWAINNSTKEVYKTQGDTSALTKNCVYLISCKHCKLQYVGETRNNLLTRFTQHRYNITRKRSTGVPLTQHFIAQGWDCLEAVVLEANPRWSTAQRRRAEKIWIARLGTTQPLGLNERYRGNRGHAESPEEGPKRPTSPQRKGSQHDPLSPLLCLPPWN
ncbi:uncharacterized protein LOC105009030 isoform X2 [Esox lucius]|uniref:uncharacterized protein LOC105009030 isoform X2 n=1 Tax=Esox lucius TaxID=8010 RepID=UPI001476CCA3|nr:uncharacterized protein LOC105009030 isoform X2 [Esox lucius]